MTISKTNQVLINKIKKTLAQHVKNPKALLLTELAIAKVQGQHSKLKELVNMELYCTQQFLLRNR